MNIFDTPKWGFRISPNDNLFQCFAEYAWTPDFQIWREAPGFVCTDHVWASCHLNDCRNVQDLADRATALRGVFDGAMYIEFGCRYEPPAFRRLLDLIEQREYEFPEGNVLAEPFSRTVIGSYTPERLNPMARKGPAFLVFLARYDVIARGMLKQLGFSGPDFRTLFSLLDWMIEAGWDNGDVAEAAQMSVGELKRFTATANNVTALGPHARHGAKGFKPPRKPMSLTEAQNLILPASHAFLASRADQLKIQARWDFIKYDDRQ